VAVTAEAVAMVPVMAMCEGEEWTTEASAPVKSLSLRSPMACQLNGYERVHRSGCRRRGGGEDILTLSDIKHIRFARGAEDWTAVLGIATFKGRYGFHWGYQSAEWYSLMQNRTGA